MSETQQFIKTFIADFTFLSTDVLHVYGGVFFFLIWLYILKKKKTLLGLCILYAMAVLNEVLDISYYLEKTNRIDWSESISDIFNTVFLPTLFFWWQRKSL